MRKSVHEVGSNRSFQRCAHKVDRERYEHCVIDVNFIFRLVDVVGLCVKVRPVGERERK